MNTRISMSRAVRLAALLASCTLWTGRLPADDAESAGTVELLGRVDGFDDRITSVAFSPNGKLVAVGSYDAVCIVNPDQRTRLRKLPLKRGYVNSIAFSRDSKTLFAGCYQRVLAVDVASGNIARELKGPRGQTASVAVAPDGKQIFACGEDGAVWSWNDADTDSAGRLVWTSEDIPLQSLAVSPDGKSIAVATGDPERPTRSGSVELLSAHDGQHIRRLAELPRAASAVVWQPNGAGVVATCMDEKVYLLDINAEKPIRSFEEHARPVNAVAVASTGRLAATGSGGGARGKNELVVWNPQDGEVFAKRPYDDRISSIAVSPDGRQLVHGSYDRTIAFWSLPAVARNGEAATAVAAVDSAADDAPEPPKFKAGIIGLDTSHVLAFSKLLNAENPEADIAGCRVVAAYPKGSPDIESSTVRVPKYTEEIQTLGVEIVDSIDELLKRVDVVFLETNDGRPHLEQYIPCAKAGKPVFIDKPIAGSLADAIAIFNVARKYEVPVFSSSSLRFSEGAQALRNGKIGKIFGCDAYSPCSLEKTHPDLFWYGIHGVETLFTVMGPGCESVTRASTPELDVVTGTWSEGRIGTFRGIRTGRSGYGGTAFGEKGIEPVGKYGGYRPLVVEIVKFFRTGQVPVSEAETLEIYAFMEAADESKRRGGAPVKLSEVMDAGRKKAAERLDQINNAP